MGIGQSALEGVVRAVTAMKAQEVVQADLDHILGQAGEELGRLSGSDLLLTGGAGFLGYYLSQAMLEWNRRHPGAPPIRLTLHDNFARGVPSWIETLAGRPGFSVARHDVTTPLPAGALDFAFVIHAASIASPTYYRLHPLETMDANVNGLRLLLERFRAQKERGLPAEGFLFFSTSEIYGDPDPAHIPTPEEYRGNVSCTGPRACYDESKRYGETLCVTFARSFGLPVACARPFNNYGPGLKITDRRVIPDFARDILVGRDMVLLSDGSPTRTFCYVADAVAGYLRILVRGRAGEAYNIGTEEPEIPVAALAEEMARLGKETLGYRGKVVRGRSGEKDYLTDNPNRRCPDIRKARRELGFDPSIPLEEGLRRSLCWYAENRGGEEG